MTLTIVLWSGLMLAWLIAGTSAAQSTVTEADIADCTAGGFMSRADCVSLLEGAEDVGTGIGVTLIFVLWFFGFIVLSLVWLMTRPRRRMCPTCGEDVRKGVTVCRACGHDFKATPVVPSTPAHT
jgi:hypothetical protein